MNYRSGDENCPDTLQLVKVQVKCIVWQGDDFDYEVEVERGNEWDLEVIGQLLPSGIDDFEIQ